MAVTIGIISRPNLRIEANGIIVHLQKYSSVAIKPVLIMPA